ncbi:thioredoxin-related transmembrane protein 1 [Anthonomus grandis grandis]|uniref:thioredoxin-related transmembrane protein 1 n=1 Tax=Anthonomus grandis grandis TaxID=2921223 RepID=UPI0021656080|nr:thioredoxin-related transmembrane protein 1 [Anthonomus grandis grandis]
MAFKVAYFAFLIVFNLLFIVSHGQKVVDLDEDNWSQILQGEWMVEFFAPWCPACKSLESRWKEFARSGPALGIKVGAVDVTASPGLSGRFMVTALPTIYHVLNGQFRQYKGARDVDSFSLFIEDRKWEVVEPVSSWKAPNSLQMSVIASFFKMSQTLRQIHSTFTNEYGWPTAVSYLIFAVATIILGACLGLILVCAIDLIFPQKPSSTGKGSGDQKDKESDNELNDEDIKDDLLDQEELDSEAAEGSQNSQTESEGSQKEELDSDKADKPRKRKTKRLDM